MDKQKQSDFLNRGNIQSKTDCHTCWARPLCAGGCHHEAFVRYGDTGHPNLHYCDWIRGWTHTCLEILRRSRREKSGIPGLLRGKEGGMKHLRAVNRKALRIEEHVAPREDDCVALQNPAGPKPHIPMAAPWSSSLDGKSIPQVAPLAYANRSERDLFDCYVTCFWPAHVPII